MRMFRRIFFALQQVFKRINTGRTGEIVLVHITTVKDTIPRHIGFVSALVNGRQLISRTDPISSGIRALDKIVRLYIGPNTSFGITTEVVTATATPVIHHIVDVLVKTFHLMVTGIIIGIEIPVKRYPTHSIGRLAKTTGRVRQKALAHNGFLNCDISYSTVLTIGIDRESLIFSP